MTLTEPTQPGGAPDALRTPRTDLQTRTDLTPRSALPTRADLPTRSSVRAAALAAAAAEAAAARPTRRSRGERTVATAAVMTLTAGLFGTMALPAFAQTAPASTGSSEAAAESASRQADGQTVAVDATVAAADASRDGYTATSQESLDAAAAAVALASQREAERAQLAASYDSYTGPTASEYLSGSGTAAAATSTATGTTATPGAFSLANVYQTALQYVGTPYVFGGATPAGFDCSGFVMFVYAQYGISMPHSVTAQGALGTPISASEAQPGDVVIFNDGSHDGFYAGNGMILDAPKPGGSVSVRPLWTSAVHYVRFGV
ncbi:hypothetical protein ASF82_11000 [Frigoribacterium sp. Leaf164]|uniref:C40 family peptidase n=1 Tax=Frigoribacterium sp. Leaf164 TaxID=1736282 RepID=UPI0006F1DADB|nr:C40 family peptidase [Frigoribacterium sp. Leaf164]KQR44057.1 hypothetical protein ASF82_11000 [Frigoribacterium sp. Leaf164]